jgi:hypothetical protein
MQAEKGITQPLPRENLLSLTPSHMPNLSDKDKELFSALHAGASKTEVEALLRNGADVNAKKKDMVLIYSNVFLFCRLKPTASFHQLAIPP